MPRFEKLTAEEVDALTRRRRVQPRLDLTEYIGLLGQLTPGEWARITLEEGETQRAIKRRFTMAAKMLRLEAKYRKSPEEGQLYVRLQEPRAPAAPTASDDGLAAPPAPRARRRSAS